MLNLNPNKNRALYAVVGVFSRGIFWWLPFTNNRTWANSDKELNSRYDVTLSKAMLLVLASLRTSPTTVEHQQRRKIPSPTSLRHPKFHNIPKKLIAGLVGFSIRPSWTGQPQ